MVKLVSHIYERPKKPMGIQREEEKNGEQGNTRAPESLVLKPLNSPTLINAHSS